MPGELEIISRIRSRSRHGSQVIAGIGDDAAVLRTSGGRDLLACCDLSIEGVHFRTEWVSPGLIGRKALAVNLSDIAAMGGVPLYALVSIAISRHSTEYIDELFAGMFELADSHGVSIVGGDTSSSPGALFIDVTVIGECDRDRAVLRSGARPGDLVFVTGSLGASALGLLLLQEGKRLTEAASNKSGPDREQLAREGAAEMPASRAEALGAGPVGAAEQEAIKRHLSPEPRVTAGRVIGQSGIASAMIDISDGLSTDLSHILEESGCGAVISARQMPIHPSVALLAESRNTETALDLALHGGEEYELLFTVPISRRSAIEELAPRLAVPITQIGEIVEGNGIEIERDGRRSSLAPSGYEHKI